MQTGIEPLRSRILFGKGVSETLLFLVSRGPSSYSMIRREGVSLGDRSLSRVLKELQENKLVERKVLPTFPVSTEYSLTRKGHRVAKQLQKLEDILTE